MKELKYNPTFLEKVKNLKYRYEARIPEGIYYYFDDILNGNNIEMYMQLYNMPKDKLIEHAKVSKIIDIYKQVEELVELVSIDPETLDNEELEEYQRFIDDMQTKGEEILSETTFSTEEETTKSSEKRGLIIYPCNIVDSIDRIEDSRSGREEQTQKSISNLLEQLVQLDYFSLRKKGDIHQHVQTDTKKPCYVDGNAFERIGSTSTKVNYIRVPISEKNREAIKNAYNIDFKTMYLVVSFGDFKNEGLDESQFYNVCYANLKKNMKEILFIMNIFKNDFTPETYSIATKLVDNGLETTDQITSIKKNKGNKTK